VVSLVVVVVAEVVVVVVPPPPPGLLPDTWCGYYLCYWCNVGILIHLITCIDRPNCTDSVMFHFGLCTRNVVEPSPEHSFTYTRRCSA
jgi:hypothetical protein